MKKCYGNLVGIIACLIVSAPMTKSWGGTEISANSRPDESEAPIPQVEALLAQMTLEEKIGQMTLFTSDWTISGPSIREGTERDIRAGRVGAVFNAYTVEYTRRLQEYAVNDTRLGIPLLFGYDVIHGHRTIFPISIGEAASWDLAAIENSARISAREAAAEGIHWTFAPMVDISRDSRWGRVSEGAGEDVFLGEEIARARVRGFQGDDLARTDTILATAKHFAAYGQAQAGRDYHTVDISERTLREIYLPPFKAALDAGAATFMTAFNEYDGVPATGSDFLFTDVLRDEWDFDGFVVTDYTAINEMVPHGYAVDLADAAAIAANAGVDMDMQGAAYMDHLADAVKAGRVSLKTIDTAVRRILTLKHKLGLFDDPYRYNDAEREKSVIYADDHLSAARDVARKSIVLLKNENGVLPITPSVKKIALIGPLADSKADMIGSWSAAGDRETRPITLLEGLRERFGEKIQITYTRGASYDFDAPADAIEIASAVKLARDADLVIVAIGEHWIHTGEAASRTSLQLPGGQQALLRALKEAETPIAMVVMSGRPLAITWASENIDAILMAWYPGTMGGAALADILAGDFNPSGKLPITFPRNVGQVPIHYDLKNTGRPINPEEPDQKYVSRYLDTPNSPLYSFGFGLSYTSFAYSDFSLSSAVMTGASPIEVSVKVTNIGSYEGEEVVQLYLRDHVGSTTRPVQQLKGFKKIALKPGEIADVSFIIDVDTISFVRRDMSFGPEPGTFTVMVGGSSDNVMTEEFSFRQNQNGTVSYQ